MLWCVDMSVNEFKSKLAVLVNENRNREAIDFVAQRLPEVRQLMSAEERVLIADWMEGVEMALDLGIDASTDDARALNSA